MKTSIITITPRDFATHRRDLPALIPNALADWPLESFTPRSLSARLGDRPILAHYSRDGRFKYGQDNYPLHEILTLPFSRFVEAVETPGAERYYIQQTMLDEGDLAFLPPSWFHATYQSGPSLSFNYQHLTREMLPAHLAEYVVAYTAFKAKELHGRMVRGRKEPR